MEDPKGGRDRYDATWVAEVLVLGEIDIQEREREREVTVSTYSVS
jgi:hypothetical protein